MMNVFTKPIMFFFFIICFIWFINVVLIFVQLNQMEVFLQSSALIVEKNGDDIESTEEEISQLNDQYNNKYIIKLEPIDGDQFLDSFELEIEYDYQYFGSRKDRQLKRKTIITNKQM